MAEADFDCQLTGAVLSGVTYDAAGGFGSLGRLTSLSLDVGPSWDNSGLILAPLAQLTLLTRLSLTVPVHSGSGAAWLPPSLVELKLGGNPDAANFSMAPPLGATWMMAVRACTRLESLEFANMAPCDVQLATGAGGVPRARSLAGTLAQARARGRGALVCVLLPAGAPAAAARQRGRHCWAWPRSGGHHRQQRFA